MTGVVMVLTAVLVAQIMVREGWTPLTTLARAATGELVLV